MDYIQNARLVVLVAGLDFGGDDVKRKQLPVLDIGKAYNLSYEEGDLYHTLDLLKILKEMRSERTSAYKSMKLIMKYRGQMDGIKDVISMSVECYRVTTKKQRMIEDILAERLGYVPTRIDDKLLIAWQRKVDDYESRGRKNR